MESHYSQVPLGESSYPKESAKRPAIKTVLDSLWNILATGYRCWLKKINPNLNDRIEDIGYKNGQLLDELLASGYQKLEGFDPSIPENKQLSASLTLWKNHFTVPKVYLT